MNKHVLAGMMLALGGALTACGGGGGGGDTTTPPTSPPPGGGTTPPPGDTGKVAGPMDAVQDPVSQQVFAPLASAFAGTPIQGIVICGNQIVVVDAIDVVDAAAVSIQAANPSALASPATAAQLQDQLQNVIVDLNGLLSALDGNANGCLANALPTGTNPLAGTPLEPVGAALAPVLDTMFDTVAGTSAGSQPTLPLSTVTALYSQLSFAVQNAFSQLPPEVSSAPVVGDVLASIQYALLNMNTVVAAVGTGNQTTAGNAVATAMNGILTTVLLDVVPIREIENQAGQPGVISSQVESGIDEVTAQFAGNSLDVTQPQVIVAQITAAIDPVVDPIQSTVLGNLIEPIQDALAGTGSSADPLAAATEALEAFLGGTPTPLLYITSAIQQLIVLGDDCPTAGTPLEVLCTLDLGLAL